ncbi:putative LRR receptor-like serine/threonine-protein kinase [Apostasia shenzhenica]|uniref:Putative LRR receptor-like serine/threonine-protein kinase n=1 Tax=Apostasia shenzhenica TaxID=1088818 RepID=A0A2I0AG01_9ASPA|nr:putative LRR receptor-like serine/threonine-protein kinase [Apostasia shenzhenica]
MGLVCSWLFLLLCLVSISLAQVKEFVSIDCGGKSNYSESNTGLSWVSDAAFICLGDVAEIKTGNSISPQYKFYRYFPVDNKKYCYTLNTTERRRYLVRATFLYGDSYSGSSYPMFKLYLDSTLWATITINDASRVYLEEMIIWAQTSSFQVCLCCSSTGFPFISTLELRPLNLSMYFTSYEENFFLKVSARINFGAISADPLRYPDDPYDRIWESDLEKRQNFLVGMAPGTKRVSTSNNIKVDSREFPPVKVMQTAVVGTKGSLSYRLDLEGFPGNARAYAYLAEIEDLGENETRKFAMKQPDVPGYSNVVVNIAENANGSYALYEPSYMNISLDFVLSFLFSKTHDSTRGPLLNAIEISKYAQIIPKTDIQDVSVLDKFSSMAPHVQSSYQNGDPCIPATWDWVTCSSLDGNFLSGTIPDLSNLMGLKILHLENNRFNGQLPSYFGELPNLKELCVSTVRTSSLVIDDDLDVAYCINFSALEEATGGFSRKIGEGSYGPVYYGKMMDGTEVAVKVSTDLSSHGTQQFVNEVTLLSRIHHKSLVPLIGYCQEECSKILVYEYMHNGTLRDHIHGGLTYLHNGCNPPVIHRDVKTSNILLDINMRAKVSDFGLSRQADECLSHISSLARGTVGYVDPEYYANQQFSDKSDVYSFGVVLLELVSGKKPISVEDYGADWNIVHWARSLISEGDAAGLIDPCLAGTFELESLWRIAEIAVLSVQIRGVGRPKMQEVELAIRDAISIEMRSKDRLDVSPSSSNTPSTHVRFSSMPLDVMSLNFQNRFHLLPSIR